jgi:D-arabinose 1-dehydrogenase-like Zn-dependent alcohol dehydrogenase
MSATQVRSSSTEGGDSKMKAVNYQGPYKVKVEEVPKPTIEHPDDVIVKVTTTGTSS